MTVRSLTVLATLLVLVASAGSGGGLAQPKVGPGSLPAGQKEVVFLGFGGTHEKNMRERVLPPFERQHGIKVVYVTGTMGANFAKVQAQRSRPEADVLWNNDLVHLTGKGMGLFERLDPERVRNLRELYDVARDPDGIGVMQGFQAHGLAYNTRVFAERRLAPPTSWRDLWRPELKGRVGLYAWNNAYAQYFMPMIARLEGGGERNIEPAFLKVKELAPSAPTFANTPAELDNLFKQREVWIAHNGSSRVYELAATGFPIEFVYPREGAILFGNWFDVVKGAPHPEAAQELVNYLIGVEAQALYARHVFFGPINRATTLDPETAKKVPYGPERVAAMVKFDFQAMNESLPRWTERWNKEVERR
jgi:putative spermidine/putrescine transport system substrate-binding protein